MRNCIVNNCVNISNRIGMKINFRCNPLNGILTFLMVFSFLSSVYAQESPAQKRAREHAAVKNFIQSTFGLNPFNTSPVEGKGEIKENLLKTENTTALERRKSYFMNGNKVQTDIYNYGAIAPGFDLIRGINNGVWRGSSYIFQFCPIFAASVPSALNPLSNLHIVSDGLWDYPNLREVSPTGERWMFEPIPGYSDPNSNYMASNPAPDADNDGKPDSWPREWYNPTLGKYVWPGYLEQDATNADQEVFWAMDDRFNAEFPYYPKPSDTTFRGLGIQVDGRALQWSNTLAENSIFFVYTVTNVSEKNLDSVYFGIYGDCDVGGGSPENTDDNGLFIPPYDYDGNHNVDDIPVYSRSMVYFFDPDGTGDRGVKVGYVASKFLESPGNEIDGVDNDGDGMIDESQFDGIDNDGDWNPVTDDVGLDGIPNTGDTGEGDGIPTAGIRLSNGSLDPLHPGEPNFEFTDLDEADQIGLSSFNSWSWNQDKVSNDESMWNRIQAGNFGDIIQNTDIVFIFGSGSIQLKKQETKRISMSLLFGETLDDLLISAETVQRIYNANYRFFKPPKTPKLSAIGGDKKVTLYWDSEAEQSRDPLTGFDFEGYVLYRSTDYAFSDIQTVTDGKGNAFFSTPLKDINGMEAKWDIDRRDEPYTDVNGNKKYDSGEPFTDINLNGVWNANISDWWKGYHPVSFLGRGIQYYIGNNNGLVHSYVDSNNVINGQTYFYALVAYDHGDSVGIPPSETTKKITLNPITGQFEFDDNTVMVIPGPRTIGYIPPSASDFPITQTSGIGNGSISLKLVNDLEVPASGNYTVTFSDTVYSPFDTLVAKNYSVLSDKIVTDNVIFFDTNYTKLSFTALDKSYGLKLFSGTTQYSEGIDYVVDYIRGIVRRTGTSTIPVSGNYKAEYKYHPVYQSTLLNQQDGNHVFDGVKIAVRDNPSLEYDSVNTKWMSGFSNYRFQVRVSNLPLRKEKFASDYEITFSSEFIDSAKFLAPNNRLTSYPVKFSIRDVTSGVPVRVWSYVYEPTPPRNQQWDINEEIVFFKTGSKGIETDTVGWALLFKPPVDSSGGLRPPTSGDKLFLTTYRPFSGNDKFTFSLSGGKFSQETAKSGLGDIYVVPNPYVGYNALEPTNALPGKTRGERRIYFENLPQRCTIRIYTLAGELVKVLEHESTAERAQEFWNLLNEDGFSVAYGIYFAHIDAPGLGEKIIKFALIK